ncbi:MAG: dihydrodipicolinate synthase family protein [Dehalococcoidia bacterium]
MTTDGAAERTASQSRLDRARAIHGMFFPMPTVFDGKGEVDAEAMEQLIDWYLDCGVNALMPLGSFGMGPACRIDQRKSTAELIVRRVNGRVPVVIHVGAVDPYTSIELGQHARDIGADGIGIVGPYYYNDRNEWELLEHYRRIDAAVGLPVLLYHNAPYSGHTISPELTSKLADEIPNVFCVKLSAGETQETQRYLRALDGKAAVFTGVANVVPGMQMGARGFIHPPISLVPELGVQMSNAAEAGDINKALELQLELQRFQATLGPLRAYGRGVTMVGLQLRGFPVKEFPRWPTRPMPPTDVELLREALKSVGALPVTV